jgi:hypothetical protein
MIASSVVVTATAHAAMTQLAAGSCSTLQRGSCSPPADSFSDMEDAASRFMVEW